MNFIDAKKNLNRQGTKVLHDIVDAFQRGIFDDPQKSAAYCGLLACICEGKVQGVFDEDTASIKWSLTPEYSIIQTASFLAYFLDTYTFCLHTTRRSTNHYTVIY